MSARRAVYPGSFDPVTWGHVDVIARAAALFDEVYVTVMQHPDKPGCFSVAERWNFLEAAVAPWPHVRVDASGELLALYTRRIGAHVVVRGVRDGRDWASEVSMSWMNHRLNPDLETVYLMAAPEWGHVSSSRARELARYGAPLDALVPDAVAAALAQKFRPAAERATQPTTVTEANESDGGDRDREREPDGSSV
ncbi:MAG: pantetheine-phosphate adenylyltransferase [Thermaerobacter sp.]|nr:pantetheine-phosphate adenylyltransferase [Thermaerobacter sp.]